MRGGNETPFVHLHVHSEYSLLDGAARMRDLVARAAELGMKSLALTDHGVMYGAIPFYRACRAHGIKPIIGCELYLTAGSRFQKGSRSENPNYHLIVLARNETGYHNLMKLCSLAHLEGFHYKPRVDMELLERHGEGLLCLSSCLAGEVSQHLLHDRPEEAEAAALRYRAIFGDHFYLELQDHGLTEQKKVIPAMIALSQRTGIKLAATNDVHYVHAGDAALQDVLICIGTGKTVEDDNRLRMSTDQMYLKSGDEMAALYRYVPEAIANTVEAADKCELELALGRAPLPVFSPVPGEQSSFQYLSVLCREGLALRYGGLPVWSDDAAFRKEAEARLSYELAVIDNMGFSDYFLIVWDFIRFAHERGIRTGPGRGSSAGSLVAYSLRITDVDPLKYKLLFERFLNPERISMPDIDIDFNDERRDEVIAYVADKYGAEHVAQIITFGTMAAKAAVRDVGRALNVPLFEVERTVKLIPHQLGITLPEALRASGELQELCKQNPRVDALLQTAMKVEGMPRHASTHAAGVVISREPLTQYVPLQAGSEQIPLTQYAMDHLEAIGLLKMDFLGLRTLSIMERTIGWIKELSGEEVDFRRVDDADPSTYAMLGKGETTGIFQLESTGMRRVLRDLKPTDFEDIVSVLALYRPGPMEFIPKFIASKHGAAVVEFPHPSLEPILGDTYGIIVYQEQIMQIASQMAGFSLGEADLLRRAVSKKKREVLDEERSHFVKGSLTQGFSEADANRVYDMIVRFADYGFPRAHAAAYAVLAFQTAWLKAHYPVPFMAAMLASVTGNMRKTAEYADECRRMGIAVLPPDVNESGLTFTPLARTIRFGLASIKNVGTQAIDAILRERKEGPFVSLLDLCKRVDLRVVNKRVLESLIQAGACDTLPGHRAQLIAAMEETVEAAQKWRKERDDLQIELFGLEEEQNWDVALPRIEPFPTDRLLEWERELLGMYLSGHPLDGAEEQLASLELDRLADLSEAKDGSIAIAAVMVAGLKPFTNKKGNAMAFLELEDRVMRVEAVVFPAIWRRCSDKLAKDALILVKATVQQLEDDYKLLVEDVAPIGGGAEQLALLLRKWRPGARGGSLRGADGTASSGSASATRRSSAQRSDAAAVAPSAGASADEALPDQATGTSAGEVRSERAPVRPAAASFAGMSAGAGRSGSAAGTEPRRAGTGNRAGSRLFVKISADNDQPDTLHRLKVLLLASRGATDVALFYEGRGQTIALSERHRVEPSPKLLAALEKLLGPGSAVVR